MKDRFRLWCIATLLLVISLISSGPAWLQAEGRSLPPGGAHELQNEAAFVYCNYTSTASCERCGSQLMQVCEETGYRQAGVCVVDFPSEHIHSRHEYVRRATPDELRKYGRQEFSSHAPCSPLQAKQISLGHFELVMVVLLGVSFSVMSWRKRILTHL